MVYNTEIRKQQDGGDPGGDPSGEVAGDRTKKAGWGLDGEGPHSPPKGVWP